MENRDSLLYILSFKSPELYNRFLFIYQEVSNICSKGDMIYCSNYGYVHCQAVEENLDLFLPKMFKIELKAYQIFCLLSAIWLHDLELVFKGNDRAHQRAIDYISEHYEEWRLDKKHSTIISAICKRGITSGNSHQEEEKVIIVENELFAIDIFSTLFKIADKLDLNYLTLPTEILSSGSKGKSKNKDKGIFVVKEKLITSLKIDSKHWIIEVSLQPKQCIKENSQVYESIYKRIKTRLTRDFEPLKDVFKRYGLGYQDILFKEDTPAKSELLLDRNYPYKFFNFYDTQDKDIFFGRTLEISRFIGLITTRRLTVIYGEMSVGKTSLIKAGLIPELEKQGITAVYITCDSIINKQFFDISDKINKSESLLKTLKKAAQEKEIVVFIDQFENLFKDMLKAEQEEFMTELIECAWAENSSIRFVLSIRKVSLVQLNCFQDRLPQLFFQSYELELLNETEAKDAMVKPARLFNFEYEPELLEVMLLDLKDDSGFIHPIHLQILFDRMVEGLDAVSLKDRLPQEIRLEWYDSIGGVHGAISDYLDVVINRLQEEIRETSKDILKIMAIYHETNQQVTTDTILSILKTERYKLSPVLSALERINLIRKTSRQDTYQLTSEYLIKGIKERWITKKDIETMACIESIADGLEGWRRHRWLMDIPRFSKIYLYREELQFTSEGLELLLRSSLRYNFPIYFWTEKLEIKLIHDILINCLKDAVEEEEIRRIVRYFGKENISLLMMPLLGRLESSNAKIRAVAAELLSGLKHPDVIATLLLKIEDPIEDVAQCVARTLGCLINEKTLDTFLKKLTSTNWKERKLAAIVMIEAQSSKTLEPLLGRINDSSSEVRTVVVKALGRLGDKKALNAIIGRLRDPDATVRESAANALSNFKNEKILEPLLQSLNDTNHKVKISAINSLSQIKDIRAFDALLDMFKDADMDVRKAAATAVVSIGGTASFKHLLEKFNLGDWWVREAAIYGLGLLAENRCISPLLEGMSDPDWRIRDISAKAIGETVKLLRNEPRLQEILIQGLKEDPNSKVRESCILSLSNLNDYNLFKSFLQDFHDPDPEVREALSLALGRLENKDVILPLIYGLEDRDEKVKKASLLALTMVDEKLYCH